jgi:translation initiation factor IF-3
MISENASPPVCKIIDYGQFMYQQKKKEKQTRKSAQVTKELKMSPKISDHDYNVRLTRGITFLKKRYKIKLTIFFRGREIVHRSLGETVLNRFVKEISEFGIADKEIMKSGRQMIAIINPR